MRILYLIRRSAGADRTAFRDDVLGFARDNLAPLADKVTVAVTDTPPRTNTRSMFGRSPAATISRNLVRSRPSTASQRPSLRLPRAQNQVPQRRSTV